MHTLDELRRVFELHDFAGIETRAVGTLEQLEAKDKTSKETYVLERLQTLKAAAAGVCIPKDKGMGLHFDLTIPFARYVVENTNELDLPFKRYQIQKVWRGERSQDGRLRESTRTDIDVVGNGELPFYSGMDLSLMMAEVLNNLPIPHVRVLVNNRKVIQGVRGSLGITDVEAALHGLDKIDEIGPEGVAAELIQSGIDGDQAPVLLQMAQIRAFGSSEVRVRLANPGVDGELLDEGLKELTEFLDAVNKRIPGAIVADLKIARGLDYYTGSVYESETENHEALDSTYPGGRYDSLAKDGKRTYPGIDLSIGVSHLVSYVISVPVVRASRKVSTVVVVAAIAEDQHERSEVIAIVLRSRDISTDIAPSAVKFGKQTKPTDKHGIPFVWLPGEESSADAVKDIRSGEQVDTDLHTQVLPETDAVPIIEKVTD